MEDPQLAEIIAMLAARTPGYEVTIDDDITHGISSSEHEANEGARRRMEALKQGERVVKVRVGGRPTISGIVNRADVQRLLKAGATWTGPAHYDPR
jgi:hypothetical protein